MMHLSRRRVAGGLAAGVAIAAGLFGLATLPFGSTPSAAASLPQWLHTLLATAFSIAAIAVALAGSVWAVRISLPSLQRAVRAVRARRIRRRARAARAMQRAPRQHAARPHQRRVALVLVAVVVASVLSVSGVAVAINYAHGMDVATANQETGWRAWLYPIPADGLMIASSLVLVWQLLTTHDTTWRPRIGFALGIAASVGTNILAAVHTGATGAELAERVVWTTWPTFGLLASHEMLLMILQYYARQADVFGTHDPAPDVVEAQQDQHDAEQRAATAEDTAIEAQQQATAAIKAAHADAEQRVTSTQQEADEQLAALRQQVTDATRVRDEQIAEQEQQVTQLQQKQQQREEDLASLRAQLDEIDQDSTDRTSHDYAVLREYTTDYARRRRTVDGATGSLTSEIAQTFSVSRRWIQQNVSEATVRRGHDDPEALQLAATG